MLKRLVPIVIALAAGTALVAQEQQPPTPAPRPDTPRAEQPAMPKIEPPRPQGQPVNIRIELTITDQTGPGEPAKKVVTMLVADRQNASIRTSGFVLTKQGRRDVNINVDARPAIMQRDGPVQVDLGLQYQPVGMLANAPESQGDTSQTGLNERISTILENGKPVVISQAADPTSDRRITVEVKATIVK